jgi:hypothetical protein
MASVYSSGFLLFTAILAVISWQAAGSDPSPLQDICVADNGSHGTELILVSLQI